MSTIKHLQIDKNLSKDIPLFNRFLASSSILYPWKMETLAWNMFKQRSLNQIRHCLTGHNQMWHHIPFYQKILLKYLNDLKNRNFSVLWLKWTQAIKMKKSQTFFHGTYSNLTSSKYFNDFQNQSFSISRLVKPSNGNNQTIYQKNDFSLVTKY